MPLLILLLGFFFPRLVIVLLYFFTGWFARAFDGFILPLLGFFFLPLTTLWYGISETYFESAQTIGMIIAVLLDLGIIGSRLRK